MTLEIAKYAEISKGGSSDRGTSRGCVCLACILASASTQRSGPADEPAREKPMGYNIISGEGHVDLA